MSSVKIEEFDTTRIANASIQFIKGGTQQEGTPFGCLGQIEGETEIKELIKKCAGMEVKKTAKPQKMNLTVSAHIPVAVGRDLFGLSNDGLKAGVYSYGSESKGLPFIFTANVIDDFEDVVKMIAFPNCASTTGLKMTIENGGDEVAELELEFTAMLDAANKLYYEAFVSEVTDEDVKTTWHTKFTPDLVKATVPGV